MSTLLPVHGRDAYAASMSPVAVGSFHELLEGSMLKFGSSWEIIQVKLPHFLNNVAINVS